MKNLNRAKSAIELPIVDVMWERLKQKRSRAFDLFFGGRNSHLCDTRAVWHPPRDNARFNTYREIHEPFSDMKSLSGERGCIELFTPRTTHDTYLFLFFFKIKDI